MAIVRAWLCKHFLAIDMHTTTEELLKDVFFEGWDSEPKLIVLSAFFSPLSKFYFIYNLHVTHVLWIYNIYKASASD
jgi:hypothetical protein